MKAHQRHNDVPVIGGGVSTGSVSDDNERRASTPSTLSTEGAENTSGPGQIRVAAQARTAGRNHYGTFTLTADGATGATPRQHAERRRSSSSGRRTIRSPTASPRVSFAAPPPEGAGHHHGPNDVPVIGGSATGSVRERPMESRASTPITLRAAAARAELRRGPGQSSFAAQPAPRQNTTAHSRCTDGDGHGATPTTNSRRRSRAGRRPIAQRQLHRGLLDGTRPPAGAGQPSKGTTNRPCARWVQHRRGQRRPWRAGRQPPHHERIGVRRELRRDQGQSSLAGPKAQARGGRQPPTAPSREPPTPLELRRRQHETAIQPLVAPMTTDSFTRVSSDAPASS